MKETFKPPYTQTCEMRCICYNQSMTRVNKVKSFTTTPTVKMMPTYKI